MTAIDFAGGRMNAIDWKALSAPFGPGDLDWRIMRAGVKDTGEPWAIVVPYIDARAIENRLDAVAGPGNWRTEQPVVLASGVLCGLSLRIGEPPLTEWVTKWDGAEHPKEKGDGGQPVAFKGGISGALKRAAVLWGIGRALYDLPESFAKIHAQGRIRSTVNVKRRDGGGTDKITIRWDPPALPKWALPDAEPEAENAAAVERRVDAATAAMRRLTEPSPDQRHVGQVTRGDAAEPTTYRIGESNVVVNGGPEAPTEKQVLFFCRLLNSSAFAVHERLAAYQWLADKATRATMKEQIDRMKKRVELAHQHEAHGRGGEPTAIGDTNAVREAVTR